MNNFFLLLIILVTTATAQAACPNKVDPSKVVLFVDTNQSDMEIKHAEIAACKRGERLQVVPKNYKEYSNITSKIVTSEKNYHACRKATQNPCEKELEVYKNANAESGAFRKKQLPIKAQIKTALEEIKLSKAKIKSVAISGHNGGGSFSGNKGNISRQDIGILFTEFPEINEVTSLLLLGCYTGVKMEVSNWKRIFPNASLIAGYDGSAPDFSRPKGHQYIEEILVKEKILTGMKDAKKVNAVSKQLISSLDGLNSAVYLKTQCQEDEEGFYYASKVDRNFSQLKLTECEKAMEEINTLYVTFASYESGEIEPPKDTVNGDLRKMYDKVRTHEHCIQSNYAYGGINANKVFNLLFLEGIKKNFAHYYQDDLKEAEEIIANINPEEVLKRQLEEFVKTNLQLEKENKILEDMQKNPQDYIAKEQKQYDELSAAVAKLAAEPQTKAILEKMNRREGEWTAEESKLANDYLSMRNATAYKLITLENAKKNPQYLAESKRWEVENIKFQISQQTMKSQMLQNDPTLMKKVWIPNSTNLATKSRKELMENIHHMNGMLGMDGLSPKQRAALSWVQQTTSTHLVYYQNPFEWHEFKGKPEAVPYGVALKDTIKNYEAGSSSYPGSMGGYGMGMYGGTVGGAVSGSNGGGGWMGQQQQPYQQQNYQQQGPQMQQPQGAGLLE